MTYSRKTPSSKKHSGNRGSAELIPLALGKRKPKAKPAQRTGYKKRKK